MRRVFRITYLLTATLLTLHTQAQDTLVTITGKMYRAQDSTFISGNLLYEKLPYYDDMGIASVGPDGSFALNLVKGETYNFSVSKSGYRKFESKLQANSNQTMNLYIEEDVVELIKLEELLFSRGSNSISSASYRELDELAKWMNDNPTIVIQLEGHTDFAGNAEANLRLSQARVESVKDYLIEKNIKKNRIFTKAFGGTQPVTQERTDEAKALNRRVEVRVIRR